MTPAGRSSSLAERADRLGRTLETVLLAVVLSAMILLGAAQILMRNIGGAGLGWADEALRIMVLWAAMLGAVAAGRDQRHVRIDALSRYLPLNLQPLLARAVSVLAAIVCLVLGWYSWVFVNDSWLADDRVLGGALPAWSVQTILPLAFGLLAYRYAVNALAPPQRPHHPAAGH